MTSITIGVDIGQAHDPTAIAVAETEPRFHNGRAEDRYIVRHLERVPLGTPYPQVAERVAALVTGVHRRSRSVTIYVDATGVGRPVVDLLAQAGVQPRTVYFVAGDGLIVRPNGSIALGKGRLVSRLQALLHAGRVALPRTAEARALASELLSYERRVAQDGGTTYGAFRGGTHDDLVTAVGLAVVPVEIEKGRTPWDQSQSA